MKLIYHENQVLPRLAWCAVAIRKNFEIHVYHGQGIETNDNFFVEGAWDGDFTSGGFDQSAFFMGTGGKSQNVQSGGVLFTSPNHTLERLYSIRGSEIIYMSNSLPFILHMSDSSLDPGYLEYESDLNSILRGIYGYKKSIPLADGKELRLHYYCNILLNREFQLTEQPKAATNPFKNYDAYYQALIESLSAFCTNANSPMRKVQYGMVTTISKGYDAAACAAIAYEVGCNTVVSFNEPKKYADDCGDDIALKLGYKKIITKSADEYLTNSSLIEAEFVSSGELGTGIVFTAFEKEFANNIVFIGERGDKIWDKNRTDANKEFYFENEIFPGTSMIENRLRVGYIIVPMPLFGASEWPSIHEISNSEEMRPFSIGGNYDRPIPRRILETRGIERTMFGMEKKGAGFNYRYDNVSRIKKRMSKDSFDAFYSYYKGNKRPVLKSARHWVRFLWNARSQYLGYLGRKFGIRFHGSAVEANALSNPGAPSYLFNWGVHEMVKRYRGAQINRNW